MLYSDSKFLISIIATAALGVANSALAQTTDSGYQLKCFSSSQIASEKSPNWIILANGAEFKGSHQIPFGIVMSWASKDKSNGISSFHGATSAIKVSNSDDIIEHNYFLKDDLNLKLIKTNTFKTSTPSDCGRGSCDNATIKVIETFSLNLIDDTVDSNYFCTKI